MHQRLDSAVDEPTSPPVVGLGMLATSMGPPSLSAGGSGLQERPADRQQVVELDAVTTERPTS